MAINFIEKLNSLNIPFEVSRRGADQVEVTIDNDSLTTEEAETLRNSVEEDVFTALTALRILAEESGDTFLIQTGNICTFYGDASTTKTMPHSYPPPTRFDNQ